MKLSTKGRYGVKAVLDLAINSEKEHISIKSIAERQKHLGILFGTAVCTTPKIRPYQEHTGSLWRLCFE